MYFISFFKKIFAKLFFMDCYGNSMEQYIIEHNPKNQGDIERLEKEYNEKILKGTILWKNFYNNLLISILNIVSQFMNTKKQIKTDIITNWWPVTDEEWDRLNFPDKYKTPKSIDTTI